MNRRNHSFLTIAAAMSNNPHFKQFGRNCQQGCRVYSNKSSDSESEFVSGNSHFHEVRDVNSAFSAVPPPHYNTGKQLNGPRPGPHNSTRSLSSGTYLNQLLERPAFYGNHQFKPMQTHQQFWTKFHKAPDYREWDYATSMPPPHCERFKVLSYNILADYLATNHRDQLYCHIPPYILDWTRRQKNICFELGLWSADILCFQEVDRFPEIEAELNCRGYSGVWKMRTGDPIDGCATFWHRSRFKLLHEESIEYNKLGLRDNVAQICVFKSLDRCDINGVSSSSESVNGRTVVVCNIHVLFNPKRGDIKLGQMRVLLDRAYAVSKLWNGSPLVICGDFNCTPKSPLYNFIIEQKLDLSELPRDKISGQTTGEIRSPRPAYSRGQYSELPALNKNPDTQDHISTSHTVPLEVSCTDKVTDVLECDVPESCDDKFEGLALNEIKDESFVSEDVQSHPPPFVLISNSDKVQPFKYNRSAWTAIEIERATGSADCKTMEHPLELTSSYAEIKRSSVLRDSSGEPLVTSYHRSFLGTVDYIWHSQGLQTTKVLAPIPKHVMQLTRGFPTKKWGSDHIALVSEFAFTENTSGENVGG